MIYKYKDFLMHYNHNHDPKTGRFSRSHGSAVERAFEPGPKGKPSSAERIGRASIDAVDSSKRLVGRKKRSKKTSYSNLSNSELQRRINRLQMEKRYSELTDPGISRGRQKALDVLDITGDIMAIGVSAAVIGAQVYKIKKMK